jgi:alginate O-acetyltransferase complex protein AlgI
VLFNSYVFVLAFLPLTLGGFFASARLGRTAGGVFLVLASLVFYGWWRPAYVPLLLVSIGGNFFFARLIAATGGRRADCLLLAGVTANLAALAYFKYLATLLSGFHVAFTAPALPLGISFFTFTQIGFLIDCRHGLAREHDLLSYALFVTFFPHLIAGPILHNREIMPQFAAASTYRISAENLAAGSAIFLIGLLKKCLLADPLAATVATGFAHPGRLGLLGAWQTALSYSLQLYFDFSGYSDMAIGLARLFNLRFPANFNSPYKAASIIDYWQRWHMTLTRYLTLYLYDPIALAITRRRVARKLSVNRAARASLGGFTSMVALPLVITMTMAGIWHGSGITFLVFGLLHAFYLMVNHAWRIFAPRGVRIPSAASIGLTYLCVLMGSVLFRAPSLGAAGQIVGGMLGWHGASWQLAGTAAFGRAARQGAWLAALFGIVWLAPNTQQIMRVAGPTLETVRAASHRIAWSPSLPWAAAFGCAAAIGLAAIGGTGEFLYFQF